MRLARWRISAITQVDFFDYLILKKRRCVPILVSTIPGACCQGHDQISVELVHQAEQLLDSGAVR